MPEPLNIIIAEDNPINARVASALLKALGFSIEVAGNGEELIKQMTGRPFDLVFMDISMPRVDGYEATMRIRDGLAGAEHKEIPIVAITALSREDCYQTCMDVGMNGFMNKPVHGEALKRAILSQFPDAFDSQ